MGKALSAIGGLAPGGLGTRSLQKVEKPEFQEPRWVPEPAPEAFFWEVLHGVGVYDRVGRIFFLRCSSFFSLSFFVCLLIPLGQKQTTAIYWKKGNFTPTPSAPTRSELPEIFRNQNKNRNLRPCFTTHNPAITLPDPLTRNYYENNSLRIIFRNF